MAGPAPTLADAEVPLVWPSASAIACWSAHRPLTALPTSLVGASGDDGDNDNDRIAMTVRISVTTIPISFKINLDRKLAMVGDRSTSGVPLAQSGAISRWRGIFRDQSTPAVLGFVPKCASARVVCCVVYAMCSWSEPVAQERGIMATVTFDKASRIYSGSTKPAVDQLDLDIKDGEFLVLVGPSGCGKSTSLRMLAGLEPVDQGTIRIGERDVTDLQPRERDIAMVFQNYALYPHFTVADNMAFALKIAKVPKDEINRRVQEAAKLLDLEQYLERKPKALSGGQRQRVAMGRAIVREPQVFLMDEPLSNLDAKLRVQTRTQIAALQRRLGTTTVYVTHDQVEAMTMGDRVAVLKDGLLQQVGTPRELYDQPENVFVAGFIGSPPMNLVPAKLSAEGAVVGGATVPLDRDTLAAAAARQIDEITIGFRPEDVTVSDDGAGIPVEVQIVEELGADAYAYATLAGPNSGMSQVVARTDGRRPPMRGEIVHLLVKPDQARVFDPRDGARIS